MPVNTVMPIDLRALEPAPVARHLDDEDGVLRRQRDQQHQTDLDIEVVVDLEPGQRRRRPDQRQRHRPGVCGNLDRALGCGGRNLERLSRKG
jgi:hypothetical protein